MRVCLAIFVAASWAQSVFAFFRHLGAFGPFLLEALDTFLFLPFGVDLLVVGLVSSHSANPVWFSMC